jgi:hypothetical protein
MTIDEIRKICRRRLDIRKRLPNDARETLSLCPECEGHGQVSLDVDGPRQYRRMLCPWCDGQGSTDRFMRALWAEHQRS